MTRCMWTQVGVSVITGPLKLVMSTELWGALRAFSKRLPGELAIGGNTKPDRMSDFPTTQADVCRKWCLQSKAVKLLCEGFQSLYQLSYCLFSSESAWPCEDCPSWRHGNLAFVNRAPTLLKSTGRRPLESTWAGLAHKSHHAHKGA